MFPPAPPDRRRRVLAGCILGCGLAAGALGQTAADIVDTKHNLSTSGPGPLRALTETRICIFCHTPHNATPLSPLWNKELEGQSYTVYASPTLRAGPLPQPSGPTKLCLSCHDGTIAMGAVLNPAGGIAVGGGGTLSPGSLSDFGVDLSGHHPVSFPYQSSLPSAELVPAPPPELVYGAADEVHCTTCHDPHDDRYGRFLLKDNRHSGLCTTCHQVSGWQASAHATSTASVAGVLPRPPKTWPGYTQLAEWGCEACHTPHFAPTAAQLLNFTPEPPSPFSCTSAGCHSAAPPSPHGSLGSGPSGATARAGLSRAAAAAGRADIGAQARRPSAHRETPDQFTAISGRAGGAARSGIRGVACVDCHEPHAANDRPAEAPYVSGRLQGVSGTDRHGVDLAAAVYEYEVCFKCHSDNAGDLDYVPRVRDTTNTRVAFDPLNPSYHPVVAMSRNLDVPSIPSSLEPALRPSQILYCTSCHADDEGGARGPHGSYFAPILKERYDTADGTPESYTAYALCYRCHERESILGDASFRRKRLPTTASGGGHSGHLAAGASCAACHDPHGVVPPGPGEPPTGDHTHLVNFDTRVVQSRDGFLAPRFADAGRFEGNCTLLCHGFDHDQTAYP
jgi:predicted CXXCH cytochrome family protein